MRVFSSHEAICNLVDQSLKRFDVMNIVVSRGAIFNRMPEQKLE